jgi:hypothetical protein
MRATSVLRHSPWDGTLVALSLVHGALLVFLPSVPLIALGLWWNANTISHNFIHLPFFRSRRMNDLFSVYLTLLLGFPQHLWRARHLAHHAGNDEAAIRWTPRIVVEAALVLAVWAALAVLQSKFFFAVYLPGYLAGLALCQLQGYFEHKHGTTSHYGRVDNTLFFRDGLHVEHHARPSTHWSRLRPASLGEPGSADAPLGSAWPPVLRWLDDLPAGLDALERIVLASPTLQRVVLHAHQAAFEQVLAGLPEIRKVVIIGGGLFPRTAIIVKQLLPSASITIVDRNPVHLESLRPFLGEGVAIVEANCDASSAFDADLVIVPLAFVGDRDAFYKRPPASLVLVHDWVWRRRGRGARVWWLLKRVNLIRRTAAADLLDPGAQSAGPRRAA